MHITELHLHTTCIDEQRTFFEQILELQMIETSTNAFMVQAGTTKFTFHKTEQTDMTYHYAFTIAHNTLASAKDWLRTRGIALMRDGEQEEFASETWNANSIYFHDGANNIAEFIVHNELPDDHHETFGSWDILRISEIGLVVNDVTAQVTDIKDTLNIRPYRGSSDDFTAVGDAYGLFILVKKGRPWRPTTTEEAVIAPVQATIQGTSEQSHTISNYPYTIKVIASE